MFRTVAPIGAAMLVVALATTPSAQSQPPGAAPRPAAREVDVTAHKEYGTHFETSERCFPCHNGITTKAGEDISIGINWRTSMMGNAGRDPVLDGWRPSRNDRPSRCRRRSSRTSARSATCR